MGACGSSTSLRIRYPLSTLLLWIVIAWIAIACFKLICGWPVDRVRQCFWSIAVIHALGPLSMPPALIIRDVVLSPHVFCILSLDLK